MAIANVIFDWSGTLVDDLPAVLIATNHVLRQVGSQEFTLERFREEFCLPFKKFYDRFTPDVPMHQLEEWFHASFRQVQDSVVGLPHAREFLEACSARRLRLFVLSAVHREHIEKQLQSTGFAQYFERVYSGVLDKQARIRDVLTENQLRPQETLLVGDMQHDIETAKHGGVFACGVLTGYNSLEQLRAAQPDWIVAHLGELQALLVQCNWNPGQPAIGTQPPGAA